MFEKYTQAARVTVFNGRYQAGLFGSETIELEHLLLGLLQADDPLAIRVFKSREKLNQVRHLIESKTPRCEGTVSADIPLSDTSKRALAYAAEEANRLNHSYIAPEHLLLGIARENTSIAARVVLESGITFSQLEEEARRLKSMAAVASAAAPIISGSASTSSAVTPAPKTLPDLVAEARRGEAGPPIGRNREVEQILQILSRRTKNSVVLIGDPGIGKESVVYAVAQRIADGDVPSHLAGRSIFRIDAPDLARALGPTRSGSQAALHAVYEASSILYVRGLFDRRDPIPELASYLRTAKRSVITTGAPLSFRLALDRDDSLARNFEAVQILAPTEEETARIVHATKETFERFHGIIVSAEAIETAIDASARFLRQRALPDRVLDLIDEAGASLKVRRETPPPELAALQRRLRSITQQQERAILSHDFEAAKRLSEQERTTQDEMQRLRQDLQAVPRADNILTGNHILEAISARTSLSVASVRATLERPLQLDGIDQVRKELAALIPPARRDWIDGLLAYLTDCSTDDCDRLVAILRTSKLKLNREL